MTAIVVGESSFVKRDAVSRLLEGKSIEQFWLTVVTLPGRD
jgi:hypothetical protein